MAVTNANVQRTSPAGANRVNVVPVDLVGTTSYGSNWQDANTAPETADNSGSSVINPSGITRADVYRVYTNGIGTKVSVRLKYDDGLSGITDPVVQLFGIDGAGNYWPLVDSSGNHEKTLTTAATDVTDGTFDYTKPIDIELAGCASFIVVVKTALAATGTVNTSVVQVRVH